MSNIYVIAEIGINHNGSMKLAKKLIDQAFLAGSDAVKFQKRTVDLVYTQEELDKYRESPWGNTNRQQKEGLELSIEQFKDLEEYSNSRGLDFIVSCWDLNSVDEVENNLNVKYHKVASALATDKTFLEKLNDTGRPIILSTGMCTEEQIHAAVDILDNVEYILACTSTYPTAAEEVNLLHINTLSEQFPQLKIGFSNHYNGVDACVGAAVLGSSCIEFHITNDRASYGSDQAASIQNADTLVDAVRKVEIMLGDGVKKVYDSEKPIAEKLRKVDDTQK
jgi:N-acetylneuraminate synthase